MNEEKTKKFGRPPGLKNRVYHPSRMIRVPEDLVEPIELMVKAYRNQRRRIMEQLKNSEYQKSL